MFRVRGVILAMAAAGALCPAAVSVSATPALAQPSNSNVLPNPLLAGAPAVPGESSIGGTIPPAAASVPFGLASADINFDGVVDIGDLTILLSRWDTAGPIGDFNADGLVDAGDLAILLSYWGDQLPSPDLTGDGLIDAADLAQMLSFWGGASIRADLNQDGVVNALDLATLLSVWRPGAI